MSKQLLTKEEAEQRYRDGIIDKAEYRARMKGFRKGWDEEKVLRRADLRRESKGLWEKAKSFLG